MTGLAYSWSDGEEARAAARRARIEAAKTRRAVEEREPRVDQIVEGLRRLGGEDRFGEAIVRAMRPQRSGLS